MLACNLIRASHALLASIARARLNSASQMVAQMAVTFALLQLSALQVHLLNPNVTLASIVLTGVHLVLKNDAMLVTTAPQVVRNPIKTSATQVITVS